MFAKRLGVEIIGDAEWTEIKQVIDAGLRYHVYTPNQAGSYDWYQTKQPRYVLAKSAIIDTQIGQEKVSSASDLTFASNSMEECNSFVSYLNTKFVRFFVGIYQSKLTGMLTDHVFRFVPAPPSGKFDHIYTDEELYKTFNLPKKYIDVIDAVIKERK